MWCGWCQPVVCLILAPPVKEVTALQISLRGRERTLPFASRTQPMRYRSVIFIYQKAITLPRADGDGGAYLGTQYPPPYSRRADIGKSVG